MQFDRLGYGSLDPRLVSGVFKRLKTKKMFNHRCCLNDTEDDFLVLSYITAVRSAGLDDFESCLQHYN